MKYWIDDNTGTVWNELPSMFYQNQDRQCMHENCPECGGTGTKKNGLGSCIHMISCPCPKCTPRM